MLAKEITDSECSKVNIGARCRRRRRFVKLFVVLAFIGLTYTGRGLLLPEVARFLNVGERPTEVDYVMVLGGDLSTRPFAAAIMYRARLAKAVVFGRSKLYPENENGIYPPEDRLTAQVLLRTGVPQEALIRLDAVCSSTRDEARALAEFLRVRPGTTAAVVTNGYHTRRARSIFRRELGTDSGRVTIIGVPAETCNESNWWQTQGGFCAYLNEYCKFAYSLIGT